MENGMGKAIMALDQGTTSSRTIIFDQKGDVLAVAQQEFTQHFPQPGWVEHDLEEIWHTQLATAQQALSQAGLAAGDIHAIGITNQRETTALWDRKTGKPVAPAIVWQCRRTAERCQTIRAEGHEPMLREKTGLVADAYFSATKLAWLLEKVPGAREKAEGGELAFGTIDSWLVWNLTAGRLHITDPSNASRTLLYNLAAREWDAELLAFFDIPESLLPRIEPSSKNYGESKPELLGAAIPIAGIAGDQQAALFGQGCLEPGMLKNTYGTGCFLLINTGDAPVCSHAGLLSSMAWETSAAVSVFQHARRKREGGGGRTGFWHDRFLAGLESYGRAAAHYRSLQCFTHLALQSGGARMGCGVAGILRYSGVIAAPH